MRAIRDRAGGVVGDRAARGFTMVDLAVTTVLLVIGVVLAVTVLLPAMGSTCGGGARQLKDAVQVRGILQGMVIWSQNNQDRYPLPSLVDLENATVAEPGAAKDTTANIFSMLVYQGLVPVDLCVSPAEVNANIKVMDGYEFSNPKRAVNPGQALWDPAFSADFTGGRGGNVSYAHLPPAGARTAQWANVFNAERPVVGNRGPEIASASKGKAPQVTYVLANPQSNTLLIHGSRNAWEGHIGYNDNHVNFESTHAGIAVGNGRSITYKDASGTAWNDCLFYDEPDDPSGTNAYLGIFNKAGSTTQDFKAIWD